jgi:hypothetical protein
VSAEPDRGRSCQQRERRGHLGDGGMAADELGAVLGCDVGVQHRSGVLEQAFGLCVMGGTVHGVATSMSSMAR